MENNLDIYKNDTFTHISTTLAIADGVLDTGIKLSNIKDFGNFGFGGTDGFENGIILLDNKIYFPTDIDNKNISIALITFFENKSSINIGKAMERREFEEYINKILPSENIMYAIKFEGSFKFVKLAILPSFKKPYPKITSTDIDNAKKIELINSKGTLLIFWLPKFMCNVNSGAGKFHVHFISDNKKISGHVSDFKIENGTAYINSKHNLNLVLPENDLFLKSKLNNIDEKIIKRLSTWTGK